MKSCVDDEIKQNSGAVIKTIMCLRGLLSLINGTDVSRHFVFFFIHPDIFAGIELLYHFMNTVLSLFKMDFKRRDSQVSCSIDDVRI